jgi:hypothetical protein
MLSPPGWGPVVLQIELGATGPGAEPGLHLRVAAAEPEALTRLQQQLPRLAGPITRLGLSLEGGQLERLRPGMALWTPPAGRVQPPGCRRCCSAWRPSCAWHSGPTRRRPRRGRQPQPSEPTMLTSRCSGTSL